MGNNHPDHRHDRPKNHWRILGQNAFEWGYLLNSLKHHTTMVLKGLRGALNRIPLTADAICLFPWGSVLFLGWRTLSQNAYDWGYLLKPLKHHTTMVLTHLGPECLWLRIPLETPKKSQSWRTLGQNVPLHESELGGGRGFCGGGTAANTSAMQWFEIDFKFWYRFCLSLQL